MLLVFFFLGRSLIKSWGRLNIDFGELNYFYIFLSVGFFAFAWIEAALSWGYITKKLKNPMGFKSSVKLWSWSQAARYIPGSVWQVFGRVYMSEKKGLSKGLTLASIAIETSNLIISGLLIFALTLPFWPHLANLKSYSPYLIIAVSIFAFLHPRVFNSVTNFFVHRLDKKEKIASYESIEIIRMLIPYLGFWLIFGVGFYFLALSFKQLGLSFLPITTGIFALSWIVGFLFVIAPSGLGAREVVIVYFLGFFVGHPLAIILAVLSRVLMIIAELLVLAISAFF